MSAAELHELAAALHTHMENARSEDHAVAPDIELLAKTVLQGVHELMNMEQRLASMERRVLRRLDENCPNPDGNERAPRPERTRGRQTRTSRTGK
jgi:hypothetical protein